jgi:signal transduction histidine kinase
MADEVRVALGTMARETRIEVESPGAVDVSCDGSLVRRIMENLVNNAIKHTPAGTRIRISIARDGDRAHVAVHDEGGGVPPEARTNLEIRDRRERHSGSTTLGGSPAFCKLIEAMAGPSAWTRRACRVRSVQLQGDSPRTKAVVPATKG